MKLLGVSRRRESTIFKSEIAPLHFAPGSTDTLRYPQDTLRYATRTLALVARTKKYTRHLRAETLKNAVQANARHLRNDKLILQGRKGCANIRSGERIK